MLSLNALARNSLVVLTVSAAVVMTSCGTDDAFGKRYPVSGSVTYNGTALENHNLGHRTAVLGVEAGQLAEDVVPLLAARMAKDLAAGYHLVGNSAEPIGGADAHGSVIDPRDQPPFSEGLEEVDCRSAGCPRSS